MIEERHIACTLPGCSSSDGMSIYHNDDGSRVLYCGSCQQKKVLNDKEAMKEESTEKPATLLKKPTMTAEWAASTASDYHKRSIRTQTYNRYLVKGTEDKVFFPFFDRETKDLVGFKYRDSKKEFYIDGSLSNSGLFGQSLFNKGGTYLTITEGEYDALATFEMQGSKYPVVSIKNGASAALKDCKDNFEYINSFENIIICFDADKAGQEAANKVAALFAGKSKIVRMDVHKDPNEYLKNGDAERFIKEWWKAETFTPDGIVAGSSMKERLNQPRKPADALYPWDGLNKLTYGIRTPSIVTITAGSGLGKSFAVREIGHHLLMTTDAKIGLMHLEEAVEDTALAYMSLNASIPFHLPDSEFTSEQREKAFQQTLGTDRLFFFDNFGSTSVDNILNRVRYLAKGIGCKFIVLDHISIVVSAMATHGDERKTIDEVMTKLAMLVQECNICLFLISHLKRPEGRNHEEGAAVSLGQLRGSGSIAQLSWIVLGLERNGQHADERERNTTTVRVLKNRFSGLTGPACKLYFDRNTGRMEEVACEEDEPL